MTDLELEKLSNVLMNHYSINESNAICRCISDKTKDIDVIRELMDIIYYWNKDDYDNVPFMNENEYEEYLENI